MPVGAEAVVVRVDPALSCRITRRTPLLYSAGPSKAEDRPSVVRAGSALRFLGGRLVVVQDDVGFLALVDPSGAVEALALPRGPAGRRRFESRLDNKSEKLDLEAAVVLPSPRGERLVAFGSGSTERRERLVVAEVDGAVRVVDAAPLYAMLRRETRFSGSELNVEGATAAGGVLRLFQRANGAPARGLLPVNATLDLDLHSFIAWLDGSGELHDPIAITTYDLGATDGVRFGFTDAAPLPDGRTLFVAGAESSPNTYDDGAIVGCRVGVLEGASGRCADLLTESGAPAALKVEGMALVSAGRPALVVVTDQDAPDEPALLCEVELEGPW